LSNTIPKVSIIIPAYNAAEHIDNMIYSVKAQTLRDFECLIMNDGSKDNTSEVVRGLIAGDERFRLIEQENCGVGETRNRAVKLAQGEYIAFFDADDTAPANALESLLSAAEREDADLVIGNVRYANLGEFHHTKALTELTSKAVISPSDKLLVNSASVWNKLFRKSVITDNDLAFTKLRRYEDMLFCMQFEAKCAKIAGCSDDVYTYERRPYWGERSAMMHNDMSMFNEMLQSMDGCVRAIEENQSGDSRDEMLSALYARFVRTNFIDEIYRFGWTADKEVLDKISELIPQYREHITDADWRNRVLRGSEDLVFEQGVPADLVKMAGTPIVSFAVGDIEDADKLEYTLRGLYNQNVPYFEVLVSADLYERIGEGWRQMPNLRKLSTDGKDFRQAALDECRGDHIWFIDTEVLMSRNIVRRMLAEFRKREEILFVSVPAVTLGDNTYDMLETNSAAFMPGHLTQKKRTDINQLDYIWDNKLFSVAGLRSFDSLFDDGELRAIDRLYAEGDFYKSLTLSVITDLADEDVLARVRDDKVRSQWRSASKKAAKLRHDVETGKRERKRQAKNNIFRFVTVKIIYPLIYAVNRLKPIDKNKVLIVENHREEPSDNVRGVIDAVQKSGYNVVSLSLGKNRVRKREALKRESRFVKEFATARYVFLSDYLAPVGGFSKRKGTTVVQLWHACGAFKKFGFSTADKVFGGTNSEKKKYPDYRNEDLVCVSSTEVVWAYQEAMDKHEPGVVQALGTSRTDVFYDEAFLQAARDRVMEAHPEIKDRKVILYAPTFRGRVRLAEAPDVLDIRAMREALGDEYFLLIKHHPFVKHLPEIPSSCSDFACDVTRELAIEDLLCCADICISDYSSLVFEYSLFEKPMIFFAYDLDEYDDWRGFYYSYDEFTPGPVVSTTEEVIKSIKEDKFDRDEVIKFKDKFMSACDGHATERILKAVGIIE